MKQCPKCQASVNDNAKFCIKCGCNIKQIEDERLKDIFCPECGTKFSGGIFCPECGYNVAGDLDSVSQPSADAFGDDWLDDVEDITSAAVAEEEARRIAEEEERKRAEEEEARRIAAEAEARRRAEEEERVRREEERNRRNAMFNQRFKKRDGMISFGRWQQTRDENLSSYGPNGYVSLNGKEYYRMTASWTERKLIGHSKKSMTGYFEVEPIKWRILLETDDSALVVADKILAYRSFSDDGSNDYINSDVRKWINGEFLNKAFSSEERALIKPTTISYNADKIFIPDETDLNRYMGGFDSRSASRSKTDYVYYCEVDGSYDGSVGEPCWWLRTTYYDSERVICVLTSIGSGIRFVAESRYREGVVPALWIDKTKL